MYVLKKICVAKFALYPEIPFEHLYHLPLPSLAILYPQVASSRRNSEPSYKSHSEQLLIICLLECFFGASLTCNKTCYYPAMIEAWSLRYTCMPQFYKICTKALLGTWARNLKSFQIITVRALFTARIKKKFRFREILFINRLQTHQRFSSWFWF